MSNIIMYVTSGLFIINSVVLAVYLVSYIAMIISGSGVPSFYEMKSISMTTRINAVNSICMALACGIYADLNRPTKLGASNILTILLLIITISIVLFVLLWVFNKLTEVVDKISDNVILSRVMWSLSPALLGIYAIAVPFLIIGQYILSVTA